ncbi:MAG TPA: ABC transporter permease [Paraburkholderia sp.]|jgi:NitT/TauT family transport system permease protein|nr:ABC transporter permease [Paraburkholderia sp.]
MNAIPITPGNRSRAPGAVRRGRVLLGLAVPLAVLVLWQWIASSSQSLTGLLPSPLQVASAWRTWMFGVDTMGLNAYAGTWLSNVQHSASRVAEGFVLAVLLGVPIGLAIGWSRLVARLIDPMIQGLRPIPITAWLPFSIAIFGIRDMGAIFLIFLGSFYAVVVSTTQGARETDRNLVRAARMMGARPAQLMRRVVFPAALPSIFTGLRLGLGIAWTAVIVSEMVAVKSGLGYVLWDAYYVGRMDIVLADMASIGLLGFLTDRILLTIAQRALVWRTLQSH